MTSTDQNHRLSGQKPVNNRRSRRPVSMVLMLVLATIAIVGCSSNGTQTEASGPVQVAVISLDHAPIRSAAQEAAEAARQYGGQVNVVTYDFNSPEGEEFAAENGLTAHTPIAILINGQSEFEIDGRTIQFTSFPAGTGTGAVPDGNWTMDDLRTVLDREVPSAPTSTSQAGTQQSGHFDSGDHHGLGR